MAPPSCFYPVGTLATLQMASVSYEDSWDPVGVFYRGLVSLGS
jgi:hypothetical protein